MAHEGMRNASYDRRRAHSPQGRQVWPNATTNPGNLGANAHPRETGAEPQAVVAEAISRKVYVYGRGRDNSNSEACPSLARKEWLKPVSTLLRSIPNSKRSPMERDSRGGGHSYPAAHFPYPVHPQIMQQERRVESGFSRRDSFHGVGSDHPGVRVGPRGDMAAVATPSIVERLKYERLTMAVEVDSPGRGLHHPRGGRGGSFSSRLVGAQDEGAHLRNSRAGSEVMPSDHLRRLAQPEYNDRIRTPRADIGPGAGHRPGADPRNVGDDRATLLAPSRVSLVDRFRANDNFNCVGQTSRCASHVTVAARETDIGREHSREPIVAAPTTPVRNAPTAMVVAMAKLPSVISLPSERSAGSPAKRSKEHPEVDKIAKRPPPAFQTNIVGEKSSQQGAVDGRRRNRCLEPGCSKSPRYALPGQKAEYCSQHKMENYVDVKHPRCESDLGCVRQPTFGWEGEKARFCSAHKMEGMLDVKNPRCAEPGCMKRPRYGDEGERARFCAAHKFDNMVDLATRRGAKCNSPAKRSRDGPRSFAHDFAAVSLPGPGPRGPSMPSFNLGTAGGATAPKRGHTPAHAGGHRRATSESWIDFCPKRVYDTTAKHDGEEGDVADGIRRVIRTSAPTTASGAEEDPRRLVLKGTTNSAEDNPRRHSYQGTINNTEVNHHRRLVQGSTPVAAESSAGNGSNYGIRFTSANLTTSILHLGGELASVAPSPISPPSRSSPNRSASMSSGVSCRFASGAQHSRKTPPLPPPLPSRRTQRFDPVDYEASAILLECRSGALLPRSQRSRSP